MNTINSMGMKTSNKRENKNDHLKKKPICTSPNINIKLKQTNYIYHA